jgi:hypothetical protein
VRVSDGTDTAATATVDSASLSAAAAWWAKVAAAVNQGSGVSRGQSGLVVFNATTGLFTALYTGTEGNTITVSAVPGSKVGTFRLVVRRAGYQPEVYDNIAPADATHIPVVEQLTLAGGTDGDTGVTATSLLGNDVAPRTGMYAMRGQGTSAFALVDCDDPTAWSVQVPFAQAEGTQFYVSGTMGETVTSAAADKAEAGIDDYSGSVLLGDWLYWNDATNGVVRLVSPALAAAGKRVALAPNESILNKPLYGILGSQKSGQVGNGAWVSYTAAEIEALVLAGIDVLGNPAPGGAYWASLTGHNSSSDASRHSDSYTQMTNFLARTVNGGMGIYVGQPNSLQKLQAISATLSALLAMAESAGLIGDDDGTVPYSVVCDKSNNPQAQLGLGQTTANVKVTYQGITEELFVNLQGGATVTIGS